MRDEEPRRSGANHESGSSGTVTIGPFEACLGEEVQAFTNDKKGSFALALRVREAFLQPGRERRCRRYDFLGLKGWRLTNGMMRLISFALAWSGALFLHWEWPSFFFR